MLSRHIFSLVISLMLIFQYSLAGNMPEEELECYNISCQIFLYIARNLTSPDLTTNDLYSDSSLIGACCEMTVYDSLQPRILSRTVINSIRVQEASYINLSLSGDLLSRTAEILTSRYQELPLKYQQYFFPTDSLPLDKKKLGRYLKLFITDLSETINPLSPTSSEAAQAPPEHSTQFSLPPLCVVALWQLSIYDVNTALAELSTSMEMLSEISTKASCFQTIAIQLKSYINAYSSELPFHKKNESIDSNSTRICMLLEKIKSGAQTLLFYCNASVEKYRDLIQCQQTPCWSINALPENYLERITQGTLIETQLLEIFDLSSNTLLQYEGKNIGKEQQPRHDQRLITKASTKRDNSKIPILAARKKNGLKRSLAQKSDTLTRVDHLSRRISTLFTDEPIKKRVKRYVFPPSSLSPKPIPANPYNKPLHIKTIPAVTEIIATPEYSMRTESVASAQFGQKTTASSHKTWSVKIKNPGKLKHPETNRPAFGSSVGRTPLQVDTTLPSAEVSRRLHSNLRRPIEIKQKDSANQSEHRRKTHRLTGRQRDI